jgi:hypothetical protein
VNTGRVGFDSDIGDTPKNVHVQVDQTRRYQQILSLDHIVGIAIGNVIFDRNDFSTGDSDVLFSVNTLGRVDYCSALDNEIVGHVLLSVLSGLSGALMAF